MKKALSLALCLIMLVGVVSGCSGSGASSSSKTSTAASGSSAGATNYQKDIVMGIDSKHTTIDPHQASNTQHNYIWRMVFDTLVGFNNQTNKVDPKLATSWDVKDATTYTFHLVKNAVFHNGVPVKASDVVFTFKRAVGTISSSQMASQIKSIVADDDYTVTMVLNSANVDWLYMMTLPTAVVMSEKACTDDKVNGPGVGSGPWKLDSYQFGDFTKLVRNDKYWGTKAKAETFKFRYIPEKSARLIALQNGEIQICQDPDPLELKFIKDDPKLEVQEYKGGSLTYFAFNTKKEPASKLALRQAVASAIDIDSIIKVAVNGNAVKATSFWGWSEYGYFNVGAYEYNKETAKKYLAQAYPNGGATLEVWVNGSERKTAAELIQAQLKEVGIALTIKELDSAGLSTGTTDGNHQSCIYGMGFNIFGDDARRILQPGSAVNKAHYDNKKVMELLDLAVKETDDTKRKDDYKQIQTIIHDEVPYIPLYFSNGYFGVKKGTGGIDYYPTSHHDLSNVYIAIK